MRTFDERERAEVKRRIEELAAANDASYGIRCRQNNIRLLVDAAHPFASQLHRTVDETSRTLHLPVIRFERKYPPRTPEYCLPDDCSYRHYQFNDPDNIGY